MYFLREPINWEPDATQDTHTKVTVPAGFVTDFASIPRIFWAALPPDGNYTYAAIIHDYLYWNQGIDRDESDRILKYVMEDFKVKAVDVIAIYNGVRFGGDSAWQANAKFKKNGEKRILKEYPKDPTISWESWKKRANVFAE